MWVTNHMTERPISYGPAWREPRQQQPEVEHACDRAVVLFGQSRLRKYLLHGQSATDAGVWGSGWSSLRFNNNRWLTVASAKDAASCNACHLSPPARTTVYDHSAMSLASDCAGCHGHNGAGSSHIDGTLYGAGSCNSCHWYDTTDAGAWSTNTLGNSSGKLWNSVNAWGAHAKHINHLKARYGVWLTATTNQFSTVGAPNAASYATVCGVCHTQNRQII